MKKNLLFILALGIMFSTQAQKIAKKSPVVNKAFKFERTTGNEAVNSSGKVNTFEIPSSKDFEPVLIGSSVFDLQTNSTATRRLLKHGDGTMSAVWTYGMNSGAGFDDRGTGFNYFDGTNWNAAPDARIETHRTGWPTIVGLSKDIVFTHGTVDYLNKTSNTAFGASDWAMEEVTSSTAIPETIWPQAVTGGSDGNTIHLLAAPNAQDYNGISGGIGYFRSTDGGETWDIDAQPILSSDKYAKISGDSWAIDAVGETVAILITSQWGDIILLKSTNNGDSWERRTILDFPDQAEPFDPDTEMLDIDNDGEHDTLLTADASGSVIIDNNGLVHCAFGLMRHRAENGSFYYPMSDGLTYWNESMPDGVFDMSQVDESKIYLNMQLGEYYDTLFTCPDVNMDDTIYQFEYDASSSDPPFGKYGTGMTTFPNLVVGETTNAITMVFSTIMETTDYVKMNANPIAQHYRHLYASTLNAETGEWTEPIQITIGDDYKLYEHTYPMAYRSSTFNSGNHSEVVKFIYQFDDEPGTHVGTNQDEDPATTNYIFYVEAEVPTPVGISEIASTNNVFNMQPNPANDIIRIISEEGAKISIYNILGKEVISLQNVETNQKVNISNLASGSYIVKVESSEGIATEKLLVK